MMNMTHRRMISRFEKAKKIIGAITMKTTEFQERPITDDNLLGAIEDLFGPPSQPLLHNFSNSDLLVLKLNKTEEKGLPRQ